MCLGNRKAWRKGLRLGPPSLRRCGAASPPGRGMKGRWPEMPGLPDRAWIGHGRFNMFWLVQLAAPNAFGALRGRCAEAHISVESAGNNLRGWVNSLLSSASVLVARVRACVGRWRWRCDEAVAELVSAPNGFGVKGGSRRLLL